MQPTSIGSITSEDDNIKQLEADFTDFGMTDPDMIQKLMDYGQIAHIRASDDVLEISYKTGKHKEVVVRKSIMKSIDPKTQEVTGSQTFFQIDLYPEKKFVDPHAPAKIQGRYPPYIRQNTPDLVEETSKRLGRIV